MGEIKLQPLQTKLQGMLEVPGDKSISHRAVILGAIAKGITKVTHFLDGEDCLRTVDAFNAMGVRIDKEGQTLTIHGKGIEGLIEPKQPIYLGNSGTTARLLMGILAGLPFHFVLHGDESLSKRPMDRVTIPLSTMGARMDGREKGRYLPLSIRGGSLNNITYETPVKSAQVKSAVILAGLLTEGTTVVTEQAQTRDHTENMLQAFSVNIEKHNHTLSLVGKQPLHATDIHVPGDISSAAFFIAAAAITKGSNITISDVGINPTRSGIIDVLKKMGANIEIVEKRAVGNEPVGDITISYSSLSSVNIGGEIIPNVIDEIPIIALLASQANGTTIIQDAEELRFKETDRIEAVVQTLHKLGADIEGTSDGMIIRGKSELKGGKVDSYGDHRIGMMVAIASLIASEPITLTNHECIAISYPNFFNDLDKVSKS